MRFARHSAHERWLHWACSLALVVGCGDPARVESALAPPDPGAANLAGNQSTAPATTTTAPEDPSTSLSAGTGVAGGGGAPTAAAAGNAGGAAGAAGGAAGTAGAVSPSPAGAMAMAEAGSGGAASPQGQEPASCRRTQPDATTPAVFVIGDSTASVYASNLYPRMGWAQPLQDYFELACAKVEDKALSGRSSKSFYDEGAWTPIKSRLRSGDFVLIQFGHNDEKREDSARYTEPFGSYEQYLEKYIDDALAAHATPILLTSIERNNWSAGKLRDTHGDYPKAVRELAQKRMLTLVDMTQLTHAYFERLGEAATTKLFMNLAPGESPNYPNGNSDDTHLQEQGARAVADLALAELARQRAPIAVLLDHVPTP